MVYIDAHLVLAIPIAMLDETGEIMKQEGKRCFSYQQNPKPWHLAAPIWCIHQRPGSEASFSVTVVPCGKAAIFLPYPSSWGSFCIPSGSLPSTTFGWYSRRIHLAPGSTHILL